MLSLIDNGVFPYLKTEDELLKSLETPVMSHYSLLKSVTSLKLDLQADHAIFKMISLHIACISGLKLKNYTDNMITLKLIFENSLDQETLNQYMTSTEEISPLT